MIYRGFPTRMVYLCYISCLRYTILVGNPRYSLPNTFVPLHYESLNSCNKILKVLDIFSTNPKFFIGWGVGQPKRRLYCSTYVHAVISVSHSLVVCWEVVDLNSIGHQLAHNLNTKVIASEEKNTTHFFENRMSNKHTHLFGWISNSTWFSQKHTVCVCGFRILLLKSFGTNFVWFHLNQRCLQYLNAMWMFVGEDE